MKDFYIYIARMITEKEGYDDKTFDTYFELIDILHTELDYIILEK